MAAVFAGLAGWYGAAVHGDLSAGDGVPDWVEARTAEKVLDREFGAAPANLVLVVRAGHGTGAVRDALPVDGLALTSVGEQITRLLAGEPDVAHIQSYWATRSPALRSRDGGTALVMARLQGTESQATQAAQRLLPRLTRARPGVRVLAHGEAVIRAAILEQTRRDQIRGELLALPATVVLLLIVFRSAVAALLPAAVGALAVAGTSAVVRAVSAWTEVSAYAYCITTALGFGLAVDFCLFLLSRYREETAAGADKTAALRTTLRTAGRAVLYSAGTVSLSLAALLVFPNSLLRSVAWTGITIVLLAAAGSLLLVPAALALLGAYVDGFDVFACWRRRTEPGPASRGNLGVWGRCAARVLRAPAPVGVAVIALLVVLAAPFAHVRFGLFDDRALPPSEPSAIAGEVLRADFDFPRLVNRTSVVLGDFDVRRRSADLDAYARTVSAQPGVRQVDTATGTYRHGVRLPQPRAATSPRGSAAAPAHGPVPGTVPHFAAERGAWLAVTPNMEAYTPAARDLVRTLRGLPAPGAVLVAGPGAMLADVQDMLAGRIPLAAVLVASTMLGLVLALTRRPVLALKALVLNTLSLCATFGVIVFVFQDGHLASWVGGFTATGSTDALEPVLVFALAFGLSMDYEIMLLARICEEYDRTLDGPAAIVSGIDRTARLFTWAALTFAVVMAALASSGLILLKIAGVGLAVAVLMDATVVRGVLVPAVMGLVGRANWWTFRARPGPCSSGRADVRQADGTHTNG
uniref:MMPL family transporter n=1 Tax=Streptomyces sp. NBC_00003 TaxID=2903608 RepID=A0AAU2VFM8_9ACTN